MLAAAFPPVDLGWIAPVALVPLLVRWRSGPRPRAAALDGFVGGVVFFGVLLAWVWHFGVVAYVPFVAVLALSWAATGALVAGFVARGGAGPAVVAACWVLLEALRGRWPLGGFSWGEVGYAFHDVAAVRSLAAYGGTLLVSFVAVGVSTILAMGWETLRGERTRLPAVGAALAGVVVLVAAAALLVPSTRAAGTLRVAVLQGNDLNRRLTPGELADRYLPASHFALADQVEGPVDLVVIPESGLDADPRQDAFLTGELASLAVRLDTAVLANASVEVEGGRRLENTNFFYGPDGELEGTYVKRHLVPYGEYVPGRRWLGFVDELEQIPRDHVGGDRRAIFDVAGIRVGNLICFESAFTELSRGDVRAGAELLVVSTNNRSFRRSANAAQHVAIGQMRAVETGRSVVHAGVSGRSAVIDPHGRVLAAAGLFERTVLQRSVEARRGSTPYMVLGDWILWLSGALLVGTLLRRRFAAAEDHS